MPRQRLKTRRPTLALIGSVLVFLLACALIFYGAVLALLAFKLIAPSSLNDVSAYRTAYDYLAGLRGGDISDTVHLIAGIAGALVFLLFAFLVFKQLPRPYLSRHELQLAEDPRGVTTVEPRAIERVAETAALQHHSIARAAGRYGPDQLTVAITVRHAGELAQTMRQAQHQIAQALAQHGLPAVPIHLTLTGYERHTQRELD